MTQTATEGAAVFGTSLLADFFSPQRLSLGLYRNLQERTSANTFLKSFYVNHSFQGFLSSTRCAFCKLWSPLAV